MPSTTGTVTDAGYAVLGNTQITSAGYGIAILLPPDLPINPYYGYTFPVLPADGFQPRLLGSGRKIDRDGVIVFPPYPDGIYDIVAVWHPNAVGKTWYAQW